MFKKEYGTFLKDYVEKGGVKDLWLGVTRVKLYVADMNKEASSEQVKKEHKQPLGGNRYSAVIERVGINPDIKLPSVR